MLFKLMLLLSVEVGRATPFLELLNSFERNREQVILAVLPEDLLSKKFFSFFQKAYTHKNDAQEHNKKTFYMGSSYIEGVKKQKSVTF